MAQTTEAACLLQSGSQYTRRVGLKTVTGGMVFAGLRRGAFSLYFDDEPIYHFDLDGRWQRAYLDGTHFLRPLDGRTEGIDRVREGANLVLHRRAFPFAEAVDLDARIRATALEVIDGLGGRFEVLAPPPAVNGLPLDALCEQLERVASWDSAAWFAHRERYLSTYGPLPFLPPDSQQAILLQATLGHPGSRAFAGGMTAEPYVRSPSEFETHVRDVARLWGRRVLQARSLFLAGADALRQPPERVAGWLQSIAQTFPIEPEARPRRLTELPEDAVCLEGISAFLDDVSPPMPGADAWHQFRSLGLRRVNVGVESGEAAIRALYGTSWQDDDLRQVVSDLKAARVPVAVVVPIGAGGAERAEHHESATTALIASLGLGPGDLVYLIDAAEIGGGPGIDLLRRRGLTPLDPSARSDQTARLKSLLTASLPPKGAKVAPYSLEKQGIGARP